MKNNLRIDSHKLMYHPQRVSEWLSGKKIYPIEVEIALSGGCNHRCIFCGCDYLGHKHNIMDEGVILDTLNTIAANGGKSVIYAGEGEPLLNKKASDIINKTAEIGFDVALSSNGVLFTEDFAAATLKSLTWVRFSIATTNEEHYKLIHNAKENDLAKVLSNLDKSVQVKKKNNLKTTLGVQLVLIPDNLNDVLAMARTMRDIGVDYFTVKPYAHHLRSENEIIISYDNEYIIQLERELNELQTEDYQIYFRSNTMKKFHKGKEYDCCYGLPFIIYIDSKGDIWPCCDFVGVEGFSYGNIYQNDFAAIWSGEQCKKVMNYFIDNNIKNICKEVCRLDELNKYLYSLKHPGGHVNFI